VGEESGGPGGEYVVDVLRQSRHALANFLCYFVATYQGKRRESDAEGVAVGADLQRGVNGAVSLHKPKKKTHFPAILQP